MMEGTTKGNMHDSSA